MVSELPSEEQERLAFNVIEHFPNMVFCKHGAQELREDYEKGFR